MKRSGCGDGLILDLAAAGLAPVPLGQRRCGPPGAAGPRCAPGAVEPTEDPYEDGNGRLARALGISAQILREREGYYTALERCQRGDLDVTGWLSWFLEQLRAAAASHGAVVDAVRRKAAFWWRHRRSGFNSRQQKLLNRLLDAEPEGFTGGMTLRKAISLTQVSRATAWRDLAQLVELQAIEPMGEGRSRAYRIRWPERFPPDGRAGS